MDRFTPAYVLEPFHHMLRRGQHNVLLGLRLVDKLTAWPPPGDEELRLMQLSRGAPPSDAAQAKADFRSWILLHGFSDIHQALRTTLERAVVLSELRAASLRDLQNGNQEAEAARLSVVQSLHFPRLLGEFARHYGTPLECEDAVTSFNSARNCLQHTSGVVSSRHCNTPARDHLALRGRRFRMFFERDGEQFPAPLGVPGPENAALRLGAEEFTFEFPIGQPIVLSLDQYIDVLSTCVFVSADLGVRLDRLGNEELPTA